VIAVDLRGHGRSDAPVCRYTPRLFANDLAALLLDLGAGPVIAMGHSLGGAVVSALAVEHPALVAALVTVDAAYGADPALREQMLAAVDAMATGDTHAAAAAVIAAAATSATPEFLRTWHRRRLLGTPAHVLASVHAGTWAVPEQFGFRPETESFFAGRTCPVLGVWRRDEQATWERTILDDRRSTAVSFEGSGHWLHQERPDDFHHVVADWLAKL
jgi:pimeloyl-ACP methyl ester carboxylesterase